MEDSNRVMQWVMMNTAQQQEQQAPGSSVFAHMAASSAPMDHDVLRLPESTGNALSCPIGGNASASWNFSAADTSSQLLQLAYRSQPMNGAGLRSPRLLYATDHILAERKRREKIKQLFVELSAVIPGLAKMDKATILSNATKYVKELQQDLRAREAADSVPRTMNSVMLVKKPCHAAPVAAEPLPDVEALFFGNGVMVRIHCENGKGVIVKVLTAVEELHLGIIDANAMAFSTCTLIITITAKVMEGFTVTAEEIIGRLKILLSDSIIA